MFHSSSVLHSTPDLFPVVLVTTSYEIPPAFLEKRKRLRDVAGNHGVDLRTAALQFSAAPDVAAALVVGASSEQQILADYTSMQTKIPAEFWTDLKAQKLIEQNAPIPA